MNEKFANHLYLLHASTPEVPSSNAVCSWLDTLMGLLFPELANRQFHSKQAIINEFSKAGLELFNLLEILEKKLPKSPAKLQEQFMDALPKIHSLLEADAQAILSGDPAANSLAEVIRTYPGFYAIAVHRLAHQFYTMQVPLIPRILGESAHEKTGIDIHPGAKIGERFCIDHGTGIVIGETTDIGENVKIYQGVTLGALSVKKNLAKVKRHPTIGDGVVIYAGATILGGETIIGENAVIGGNTWITASVAAKSQIYYNNKGETFKKNT